MFVPSCITYTYEGRLQHALPLQTFVCHASVITQGNGFMILDALQYQVLDSVSDHSQMIPMSTILNQSPYKGFCLLLY